MAGGQDEFPSWATRARFFTRDGRIARGTGDEGGGNGCHVSLTLDGDGDQAGKETT